ncbi:transmembrane protein 154-like isoform X5 [Carcharodon carcharias]|uniref:transmembrane protein 154-like isoform X5 n=1 Tax=Carcharodon carcharias TaxID=13397 RepID=UPI001B7EB725|nr:transmembrane protein 154-like isoform X5 [Carcharodon carcharias]
MHTLCKGNMNQRNARLYLILSVTLFSGNTITHHDLCTNNCLTLQASKQASPTISQYTSATMILEDVHKGKATRTKATIEHLWNRSENSIYVLTSSPAPKNISKTPSNNNKVILMIVLPILGLALTGLLIAFLINHIHGNKQPLNNDVDNENPASPIFEEDVASVMEVEMDELDRWMGSVKKMPQQECLADISEDKDLKPNSSRLESHNHMHCGTSRQDLTGSGLE